MNRKVIRYQKTKRRRRRVIINRVVLSTCMVALLAAVGVGVWAAVGRFSGNGVAASESEAPPASVAPPSSEVQPEQSAVEESTPPESQPESQPPASSAAPQSAGESSTGETVTTVGAAVPQSDPVGDEYFSDAVFIGDSRTEGFMIYSGINATYYTVKGLAVDNIYTKDAVDTANGRVTVLEALEQQTFGKVYIMLGVNELGWVYSEVFQQKYGELIDAIRARQPNAIIYVQSILPVSTEKEQKDPVYNNAKIQEYNGLIAQMCQQKGVYYVNVWEALAGEDGALPPEDSVDGVHVNQASCALWRDYLKEHTV